MGTLMTRLLKYTKNQKIIIIVIMALLIIIPINSITFNTVVRIQKFPEYFRPELDLNQSINTIDQLMA